MGKRVNGKIKVVYYVKVSVNVSILREREYEISVVRFFFIFFLERQVSTN